MPQVLTTNAIITCPHAGIGVSIPFQVPPKWITHGDAVLLENDGGVFAIPPAPGACTGIPHCGGYVLTSMGLNATRVDARRVILTTDFNVTLTGIPLAISPGPLDLSCPTLDDSTAAPVPNGEAAPPLPPELLDMAAPVIVAAPPLLAFNSTTMQPAAAALFFTLNSDNPMQWLLTLLNEPLNGHGDLTNGAPPNLIVSPPGGEWSGSPLTVTVTMNAAYMASLTPGKHHFYMTGVSRRGLSSFAAATLTVS